MMKGKLLALVCWVFLVLSVRAQEGGIRFEENKTWKELLQMAGEQNKLIFLDGYATWCAPCKAMARDVFPDPRVGDLMNRHFINVSVDMEKGEGPELLKRYKPFIPGYPVYLLINSKGQVVHQAAGYTPVDKFLTMMQDGLAQRSWIAYGNMYKEGRRDWPFIREYLQMLEDAFQKETIKEVTGEVLPLLTLELISNDSAAYRVFRKYWTDAESPVFWTFLSNPGICRKYKDSEKEVNDWAGRLFKSAVDNYTRACIETPAAYDKTKASQLIENLRKLFVLSREKCLALMLLSKTVVENDGARFLDLCKAAGDFGLLRNDNGFIGWAARHFAAQTKDRARLQQYLSCIDIEEENLFAAPANLRNSAFILEKMGEKEKAKSYYSLADKKEAELKQRFKLFTNMIDPEKNKNIVK